MIGSWKAAILAILCIAWPSSLGAQDVDAPLRFADVNGVRLAYRSVGEGEPLLFLHGFYGTEATWEPIVGDFSEDHMVILPQLRGHGRSTNPSGEFTHREAAHDIIGLLDALGLGRVRAVGYSTGGMTLLHIATQQTERVSAMVLIGATSYYPEQAREIMSTMSPEGVPQAELVRIGRQHAGGVEQAAKLMSLFHQFEDSYDDMNFTPPLLSTITARTLIVHGDRDRFFPVAIPAEQYGAIPDSYLMILPNTGHAALPPDAEGREYFVATLKRFFSGEWRCAGSCASR